MTTEPGSDPPVNPPGDDDGPDCTCDSLDYARAVDCPIHGPNGNFDA